MKDAVRMVFSASAQTHTSNILARMGSLPSVKTLTTYSACLLLFLAAQVFGQEGSQPKSQSDACTEENAGCVRVGQWDFSVGIGLGGRTNPVVGNDDIPIYFLPGVSYYGQRFFWQTDTLGLTLLESIASQVNIIATISYDQTYFNDWGVGNFAIEGGGVGDGVMNIERAPVGQDLSQGGTDAVSGQAQSANVDLDRLHKRRMAGLAGLEYIYDHRYFSVGVQALADATNVHGGLQMRGAISKHLHFANHGMELTVGAQWKDADTLAYFYGVRASEVDDPQLEYSPESDVSYYAKFDWRYRVSQHWELRGIVHHRRLGDEVSNSPIVEDDATTAAFIGGVYHF